jgi:hypothetical protein
MPEKRLSAVGLSEECLFFSVRNRTTPVIRFQGLSFVLRSSGCPEPRDSEQTLATSHRSRPVVPEGSDSLDTFTLAKAVSATS